MNAAAPTRSGAAAQSLCLDCGLCCDGSLFWAVEIDAADALPDTGAAGGVAAGAAGGHLAQPCRFHTGGACGIYASRPHQCRAFTCEVLRAVRDGRREIGWARARIEAMRHLLAGLDDALPGEGALYQRAMAYLEDAGSLPDDVRIRARIAVYRDMIGDFRPLSDPPDPSAAR